MLVGSCTSSFLSDLQSSSTEDGSFLFGIQSTPPQLSSHLSTFTMDSSGLSLSSKDTGHAGLPRGRARNFKLPCKTFNSVLDLSSEAYNIPEECCIGKCILDFSPNEIWSLHCCFLDGSEVEQRQYLLSCFNDQATTKRLRPDSSEVRTNFVLKGKSVCPFAFCQLQGVSKHKYVSAQKAFLEGHTNALHGNQGNVSIRRKTTEAIAWMHFFLERVGDFMPHNNKIYVPPAYNFTILYDRMKNDFSARGITDIICYGHFTKILHSQLPDFVLGKVSTFTKCTICTNLKEERQRASTNGERVSIKKIQDIHIRHVELSRKHYHQCRERARADPSAENTVIIDGMDQSKTNLPSLLIEDKSTKSVPRLRTHITGVLFHTDVPGGMKAYAFTDILTVPHDSNLTMHILLHVLVDNLPKKGKKLNVQMDNCFRENKNRYLLGLGFLMVEMGLYEQVDFNFLPVGHTHEDVDQFFSRIAEKLRFHNAYTLEDLHHIIEESYTPRVEVIPIRGPEIFDIKGWLSPHLENIGNHSKPHHFRFSRVNGVPKMIYRKWSCDPWRPNDVEAGDPDVPSISGSLDGLTILKSNPVAGTIPCRVVSSLEKLDPQLGSIPAVFGRRLSDTAHTWWASFLANQLEYTEAVVENNHPWPLRVLQEHLGQEVARCDMAHLLEIEGHYTQDCPEIVVGTQRQQPITHVDGYSSMKEDMMVAVFVQELERRPQIGRILVIEDKWIKIHWFVGQWSGPQKASYTGAGKHRKPVTEWLDEKTAVLWDFKLTDKAGCLSKPTQATIKEKYKEIDLMLGKEP